MGMGGWRKIWDYVLFISYCLLCMALMIYDYGGWFERNELILPAMEMCMHIHTPGPSMITTWDDGNGWPGILQVLDG